MSKESIVEKIASDAKARANSFVREQNEKAKEILADASQQCKSYIYTFKAETDTMVADIESRSRTVAELDSKKIMLSAKTRLLDGVFSRAVEKLASLDRDTQHRLLVAMLNEYAEDGDVITLGRGQRDCLSPYDVSQIAEGKGIALRLSEISGDFDGMILSGNGVDKNLNYGVEISLLREDLETQIAKELFD